MNIVDIFVIGIIGLFAFIGFWKGFIIQLFHALGIFCAFYFNTPVSRFIANNLSSEPEGVIMFIVGIAAFLIIFAIFYITGIIVSRSANIILTSVPNRISGIIFGGLKGFLIVTVVFLIIRSFGGEEFLKRYVTPDKMTDNIIDKGIEYTSGGKSSEQETEKRIYTEKSDTGKGPALYSRLGYGAYRISAMMDPFVANIKRMFGEKYDEIIEKNVNIEKNDGTEE
ncbi:MAG: CvpA family protein [Candidatus Delongbacteria bacterium]